MTFKDTKYLFSKSQLSIITSALTDNLELSSVLYSVSKRIITIDDELESLLKSGYACFVESHILSPNFDLLDSITDKGDRAKKAAEIYRILDLKREKHELGNALNILTEILKKGEIK